MAATIALKSQQEIVDMVEIIREVAPTEVFVDLFRMGINVGLRISDLRMLKYEDILSHSNLDVKMIKVRRNIQMKLTDTVLKIVQERYEKNPHDTYIFESDYARYKGKPLTIRRFQQVFKEAADVVGKKFSTHSMRKTPARIMWENGVPLEMIAEYLGHKNTVVTKRYLGITQDEVDEIRSEFQFDV